MKPTKNFLELLEESHQFPGPYYFKAIILESQKEEIILFCCSFFKYLKIEDFQWKSSKKGKWLSFGFIIHVENALDVIKFYEDLKKIQNVVIL